MLNNIETQNSNARNKKVLNLGYSDFEFVYSLDIRIWSLVCYDSCQDLRD